MCIYVKNGELVRPLACSREFYSAAVKKEKKISSITYSNSDRQAVRTQKFRAERDLRRKKNK